MEDNCIPVFPKDKITTITMVIDIKNKINIESVAHLIPVHNTEIQIFRSKKKNTNSKKKKKVKFAHCPAGTIISLRSKFVNRGHYFDNKHFKNAITTVISSKIKNISLKLSPNSIHICGANNFDDGVDCAQNLLDQVKHVFEMQIKMKEDFSSEVSWLKEFCKGPETIDTIEREDFKIIRNDRALLKPTVFPEHLDSELLGYLLSLQDYNMCYTEYCDKLDLLLERKLGPVFDKAPVIFNSQSVMVNYNYRLGFPVKRLELVRYIDRSCGFVPYFNNDLSNYVTIELPYEVDYGNDEKDEVIKKKKSKVDHHTFIIYRSGSVTQSGPEIEVIEEAYYLFWQKIMEIKELIRKY